jgi:hypothetical protein
MHDETTGGMPTHLLRVAEDEDEGVTQDEHERGGVGAHGDVVILTLTVGLID